MTPKDQRSDMILIFSPMLLIAVGLLLLPSVKLLAIGMLVQALMLTYAISYYRKNHIL